MEDFIEASEVVTTETVVQAGLVTTDCRAAAYLNHIKDSIQALEVYRRKDMAEKVFDYF